MGWCLGVLQLPSASWGTVLIWAQGFHVKTVQPNKEPSDPDIWETVILYEVLHPAAWWCLHLQCSSSLPCACCL